MSANDFGNVNEMYVKRDTLSTRVDLHDKYSVNKYGWFNWVFDQYQFTENMNILELGCGTGNIWQKIEAPEKSIPKNAKIILTDISPLMIEKVKEKFIKNACFSFRVVDIQKTPFEAGEFDMVAANHMLYHVPDMGKALSEIKRVLKDDGYFYATTLGENSLKELQDIYRKYEGRIHFSYSKDCTFTLENGEEILRKFFGKVERRFYLDALEVTSADDLMNYIVSYNKITQDVYNEMYETIKNVINKEDVFKIRKDQGMFICTK